MKKVLGVFVIFVCLASGFAGCRMFGGDFGDSGQDTYIPRSTPGGSNVSPLLKAGIGDWIDMKTTSTVDGMNIVQDVHQEVVKKDSVSLTLKTVTTQDGYQISSVEEVVSLSALDSLDELLKQAASSGIRIEVLATGTDTIVVAGKSFDTYREAYQVVKDTGEDQGTTKMTFWSHQDLPLFTVARIALEIQGSVQASCTTDVVKYGFGS